MTRGDDHRDHGGSFDNDPAVRRALEVLDASVEAFDDATLARLARARRAAVDHASARERARAQSGRGARGFVLAGAMAATVAAVVLVRLPDAGGPGAGESARVAGVEVPAADGESFELLTDAVEIEFIEDLEFFEWLEVRAGTDADDRTAGAT